MKLTKLKINCTPPVGTPVGFGVGEETLGIRDPLYLRAIILDDGNHKCVIGSMDYCGLMNSAYEQLATVIADAVDTPVDNVIIHCVHQHDAPLINFEIEEILDIKTFSRSWWNNLLLQIAVTARESLKKIQSVSAIGYAGTEIQGYASNRRIIGRNGKLEAMRFSKCGDVNLKNKPPGVIDSLLRTVAFKGDNEQILASWNFYATHPQVANGQRMFSADAPGEAVKLVEAGYENSFPCFFTGAGGNITAGKYTSPDDLEGNLRKFGRILANGINHNLHTLCWEECRDFQLKQEDFDFPVREKISYNGTEGDKDAEIYNAVLKTCSANRIYSLKMLTIGSVKILFFPGEPFVEYQLFTQSIVPDEFIAVAGSCSSTFLYLPVQKSFNEGGYEIEGFCWCDERIEKELKKAIKALTF